MIYYWAPSAQTILMLDIYPKGRKENLTKDQVKRLRQLVKREYP